MKNIKVIIDYFNIENNLAKESIWAELINDDKYKIKNIPFFAPNLAYDDEIIVIKEQDNYYLEDIIKYSGHSTIQIIILEESKKEEIIKKIEIFKCSWEGMYNEKYLAIDIPKNINYIPIKKYLESMSLLNILDYKESCLSKFHKI